MSEHSSLLRPTPRRHFDLSPSSSDPPTPRTPSQESRGPGDANSDANSLSLSNRTRSILNLTSSTLFGIYAPADSSRDGTTTPWGSGIETPGLRPNVDDDKPPVMGTYEKPQMHRRPSQPHVTLRNYYFPLLSRILLLFLFGVAYGSLVTRLHDNQQIAPVKIEGIHRYTWRYLIFWGIAGVLLGRLLPLIDVFWERTLGDVEESGEASALTEKSELYQSKAEEGEGLHTSFETMVNPALWYLIDRSKPGFLLSAIVGITGTAVLLGINPGIVPTPSAPPSRSHATPAIDMSQKSFSCATKLVSNETIAVSTWIASVLFCSSVCFGNIGRRLALDRKGRRGSIG
ncbi:MAG: hypothetical protein Q9174_000008 [Haloplaca sp. 1 TL-2023]